MLSGKQASTRSESAGGVSVRHSRDGAGSAAVSYRPRRSYAVARGGQYSRDDRRRAFVRFGRDGSDIYDARFAHGKLQWRVSPLSSDGRVPAEFFTPSTGNGVRSPPP
jgi:hypothetical protein